MGAGEGEDGGDVVEGVGGVAKICLLQVRAAVEGKVWGT